MICLGKNQDYTKFCVRSILKSTLKLNFKKLSQNLGKESDYTNKTVFFLFQRKQTSERHRKFNIKDRKPGTWGEKRLQKKEMENWKINLEIVWMGLKGRQTGARHLGD